MKKDPYDGDISGEERSGVSGGGGGFVGDGGSSFLEERGI